MKITRKSQTAATLRLVTLFVLIPLALGSWPCAAAVGAVSRSEAHAESCRPSFLSLDKVLHEVRGNGWSLSFSVTLIGCEANLQTVTAAQIQELGKEFEAPTKWSILLVVCDPRSDLLRERATKRVNEILGRKVATDILVSDVLLEDHGVMANGGIGEPHDR